MAPPKLTIVKAYFGGVDFTSSVQKLVTSDQELVINPSNWQSYGWKDPWPGVRKTLAVYYHWHGRQPEVLVAAEGNGTAIANPNITVPPDRYQYNTPLRPGNGLQALAIVWGTSAVGSSVFQQVNNSSAYTPSNSFMGIDGFPGVPKTAEVFYTNGSTTVDGNTAQESNNNVVLS